MVATAVTVPLGGRWSSCPEASHLPVTGADWLAGTRRCPTSPFNYLHLWVKQPLRNGLINLLIARSTQCNYIREFRSPSATSINSERAALLSLPQQPGGRKQVFFLPPLFTLPSDARSRSGTKKAWEGLSGEQVGKEADRRDLSSNPLPLWFCDSCHSLPLSSSKSIFYFSLE